MRITQKKKEYYIKEAAELTGLSRQVIRKWEDRYCSLTPKRKENGYRVYNQEDIKKLIKIKAYQKQGYTLQEAVNNVHSEMERNYYNSREKNLDFFILDLIEKGKRCDEAGLNQALRQSYHYYGMEHFLKEIVIPFLIEVGNRWERGEWEAFQESIVSLVIRDFLIEIRRSFHYPETAPLILGACLPGEQHEIPVHIILLECLLKGWKTKLVGASPAPGSIESLVRGLRPRKVLLSATTSIPFEQNPSLLGMLDSFAGKHPEIHFYLGGYGAVTFATGKQLQHLTLTNSIKEVITLEPLVGTSFPSS
ncbi:MerR family transcriptional regulator [Oceanobacillus kapialis]|uniref:MerR family transcriptional regulator n=1 Tax=Oceanobacillus kapialis TaxID=481353 RepID=UPI00384E0209